MKTTEKTGILLSEAARPFEYLIAAAIILNCHSVYEVTDRVKQSWMSVAVFLSLLVLWYLYADHIYLKNGWKKWMFLFLLSAYQILTMVFRDGFHMEYCYKFVAVLMLMCLIFLMDNAKIAKRILNALVYLMVVLAVISLVLWIMGSLMNWIIPSEKVSINWGGSKQIDSYFGLHFSAQTYTISGIRFYRNTGIFAEAPMYAFILSFALAAELFISENVRIWKALVLSAAILSTLSLTGFLAVGASWFLYLLLCTKNRKVWIFAGILLGIGAVASACLFVYKKAQSGVNSSVNIRLEDFQIIGQSLVKRPLLGYGYGSYDVVKELFMRASRGTDTGGSNGFFYPLTQGGIFMFLPYLVSWVYAVAGSLKRKNWKLVSFFLIYLLLFSSTIISFKLVAVFMIAFGFACGENQEEEKYE